MRGSGFFLPTHEHTPSPLEGEGRVRAALRAGGGESQAPAESGANGGERAVTA